MTVNELLNECNMDVVYTLLADLCQKYQYYELKNSTDEQIEEFRREIISAFTSMVEEFRFADVPSDTEASDVVGPIHVRVHDIAFGSDEPEYVIDIPMLNLDYEEPAEGLEPWGGENPPDGHYNCNENKYNKYFAIDFMPWGEIRHMDVMLDETLYEPEGRELIPADHFNEGVLMYILYEITRMGMTQERIEEQKEELQHRIEEVDKGLCKTYTLEELKEEMPKWFGEKEDDADDRAQ